MAVPGTSIDDSIKQFRGQGTDRLLIVAMREWKTDAAILFYSDEREEKEVIFDPDMIAA